MTIAGTSSLEETIERELDRSGATGVQIALIRGGETVWSHAYGSANIKTGDALTTSQICSIMSVTKPIVCAALMQLRDEGHFSLDDLANQHLAPTHIRNEWEAETPIRIRDLMTHSSGLPVSISLSGPTKPLPLADYVTTVAKTDHRPGTAIVYANWGFDAIGVLIEKYSGMGTADFLRQRIFEPLGMSSAFLGTPAEGTDRAHGHYISFVDSTTRLVPLPEWMTIPESPAGGVWSSAEDLAKFIATHLADGGGILSPETTAEMRTLHARQGTSDMGQGLGWRVTRSNGRRLICHGGDGGGFTDFAGAYPDDGAGVVVLINTAGMQVARSVIANTALEVLADAPQKRTLAASLAPGTYRSTFWDVRLQARADGTMTVSGGLVMAPGEDKTQLTETDGALTGEGGMFHGFEVAVEGDEIYGGVYPFTFVREGDLPPDHPLDETADLTGNWRGTIQTPMAPLATTLEVKSASEATMSTPLTPGAPLANLRTTGGRLEGNFPMSVPGIGDFHNYVRLEARGGKLLGNVYSAGGDLGEVAMWTELERDA